MNTAPSTPGLEIFPISPRYAVEYQPSLAILWSVWKRSGKPCFTPQLLTDMQAGMATLVDASFPHVAALRYFVLRSEFEGVFNLGGDLEHFALCVGAANRSALLQYAEDALAFMRALQRGFDRDITTIALVEGKCSAGGFEAALACDYLFAERGVEFSFPEILLGIFPGMGALSLLARRLDKHHFEQLFHTGRVFCADELLALGIVDVVVDTGQGKQAVENFVQKRHSCYRSHRVMITARKAMLAVSDECATSVLHAWVDAVMQLDRRRLMILSRASAVQSHKQGVSP